MVDRFLLPEVILLADLRHQKKAASMFLAAFVNFPTAFGLNVGIAA